MSTHTDFTSPAILLYEPQADGSLVLVGVENLVFEETWKAAGNPEAPSINGRAWDHMADNPDTAADEAHDFAPHFDQHVWLFRENSKGELAPFNPNVTCEHNPHQACHNSIVVDNVFWPRLRPGHFLSNMATPYVG